MRSTMPQQGNNGNSCLSQFQAYRTTNKFGRTN
jgi:hypothetical protein